MEAEKDYHQNTLNHQPLRVVILVAMPLSSDLEQALKNLGANTFSGAPTIDWTSTNTESLPSIA
jgi:hypothetical protein